MYDKYIIIMTNIIIFRALPVQRALVHASGRNLVNQLVLPVKPVLVNIVSKVSKLQ